MNQDPIQRLLDEHADLMSRLEPLRAAIRSLSHEGTGPTRDPLPVLREAAVVLTTDLIAHARREDEAFFPAVESAMGESFGPTTVMRAEHAVIHGGADHFKATLHELHEVQHPAIVSGGQALHAGVGAQLDTRQLLLLAKPLLALIDDHFAKEEQVLFPMSRTLLDEAALRAVAARMDDMDARR